MDIDYHDQSRWPGSVGLTSELLHDVVEANPIWFDPIATIAMDDTNDFAEVDVPAPADHEPLVPIGHPRVACLSSYWRKGLPGTVESTYVRSGVADRLGAVADALPHRFGLALFDAWRPLELQTLLYTSVAGATDGYLSVPSSDPRTPPPHITGGTVDVTVSFDGYPLSLGTAFDDFTTLAHPHSLEDRHHMASLGSDGPVARDLRRMLHHLMSTAGFVVYPMEWWHFEYGTRRWSFHTGNPPLYGPATVVDPTHGP
jgi:D-alanyl-D-alanine dipeptidase